MPVITVHRYARGGLLPSMDGAQFVDTDFVISPSPVVKPVFVLSQAVYPATGDYVLVQYSGIFSGSLADLEVDTSDLDLSGDYTLSHNAVAKQVIVSLKSRSTNGTQYVDTDLDITGTHTFVMLKALAKTPGDYVLFDVAGTITPGSLANLVVVPPPGRTISGAVSPNPFIEAGGSGQQIKVTLA